jgi:hypothetical protein
MQFARSTQDVCEYEKVYGVGMEKLWYGELGGSIYSEFDVKYEGPYRTKVDCG